MQNPGFRVLPMPARCSRKLIKALAEEVLAAAEAQLAKETAILKAIAGRRVDHRWADQLLRQRGCDF